AGARHVARAGVGARDVAARLHARAFDGARAGSADHVLAALPAGAFDGARRALLAAHAAAARVLDVAQDGAVVAGWARDLARAVRQLAVDRARLLLHVAGRALSRTARRGVD